MQLVLVDTWAAQCIPYKANQKNDLDQLGFVVSKEVLQSSYHNLGPASNDQEGRQLVSKIIPDDYSSGHLKVLFPTLDLHYFDQAMTLAIGKLFKSPSLNSADKDVKFSLYLEYVTSYGALHQIASVEGMRIDSQTKVCIGAGTFKYHEDLNADKKVHLKLIADITDKPKVIPQVAVNIEQCGDYDIPASKKILEEGCFSDVIITTCNGIEIEGHKSFLSVQSPVLKTMFETKMKEGETGRLEMIDVSEQGVRAFLRYLYYGDLQGPKADIAIAYELLYVSHKYEVRKLEAEMTKMLAEKIEDLTVKIAFKIYMFARNVETATELKRKTIQFLKTKMDELQSLEEYKDLFKNVNAAMEVFKDFATL